MKMSILAGAAAVISLCTNASGFAGETSPAADEAAEYPPGLEGVSHDNPVLIENACVCGYEGSEVRELVLGPPRAESLKHVTSSRKVHGTPVSVDGKCAGKPRCSPFAYVDGKLRKSAYAEGAFQGCISNIMWKEATVNGAVTSSTTILELTPVKDCPPWP